MNSPISWSLPVPATVSIVFLLGATTLFDFQTSGYIFSILFIAVAAATIFWATRVYPRPRFVIGVFTIVAVATFQTTMVTRNLFLSQIALLWLGWAAVIFLLFTSWMQAEDGLKKTAIISLMAQVVMAIAGIWTFFDVMNRATGLQNNANGLGGVLLWGVMVSIVLLLGKTWRKWMVPAFILTLTALVLTVSLTAWVAIIPSVIIALWWWRKAIRWRAVGAVVVILAATFSTVWFGWHPTKIRNLMTSGHVVSSWNQRIEFDRAAVRMWKAKPWLGWGLGTYKKVFPRYTTQFLEQPLYTHNLYLQVLAEIGIFGALGWLGIVYWIGRRGWKSLKELTGTEEIIARGMWLGWLAFTVHAAVDFAWFFPAGQIIWLAVSAYFVTRSKTLDINNVAASRWWRLGAVVIGLTTMVIGGVRFVAVQSSDRGVIAADKLDDAGAIREFKQAVRFGGDPFDVQNLSHILWVRRQGNDLEEAVKVARVALKRNPDEYFLHQALGLALVAQKHPELAVHELRLALTLDPYFHPQFAYNYVMALKNSGQNKEAKRALRQALENYARAGADRNPIVTRDIAPLKALEKQL